MSPDPSRPATEITEAEWIAASQDCCGLKPMLRVLFVCVENSNRSQMAEAFARMHGGPGVEAYSAGSRPSGKINPKAVDAMHELGYDLTTHRSKSLDEIPVGRFDAAITMGCGDACPNVPARLRQDWQIPDPRDMPSDQFREVRNLIEQKVRELLGRL
jgi:arsenate reductase (thioredoxin)